MPSVGLDNSDWPLHAVSIEYMSQAGLPDTVSIHCTLCCHVSYSQGRSTLQCDNIICGRYFIKIRAHVLAYFRPRQPKANILSDLTAYLTVLNMTEMRICGQRFEIHQPARMDRLSLPLEHSRTIWRDQLRRMMSCHSAHAAGVPEGIKNVKYLPLLMWENLKSESVSEISTANIYSLSTTSVSIGTTPRLLRPSTMDFT